MTTMGETLYWLKRELGETLLVETFWVKRDWTNCYHTIYYSVFITNLCKDGGGGVHHSLEKGLRVRVLDCNA